MRDDIILTMGCPFNSLLVQVQRLLEVMGLEEYQEAFRRQQLNGDLFSDCDEDILVNELKVTSRLHRMRLMRVISGQYSVQDILSGNDGYILMYTAKSSS